MNTQQTDVDEYEHLAKLLHWAGFDFDQVTMKISVDGIILPKASLEASGLDIWIGSHQIVAAASREFNDIKEFMSANRMSR